MHAHIVLAHPDKSSFNALMTDISNRSLKSIGWDVSISNLYEMNFDPCEGPNHYENRQDKNVFHAQSEQRFNAENGTLAPIVNQEIDNILKCDLLVVHFPLWWFGPPAILKGWMDRVFVYGSMYGSEMRYDDGICVGKNMIACVTTGASEDSCSFNGKKGDTNLHLWPVLFPFRYLGFSVYEPEIFHGVGGVAFIENHEEGVNTLDIYSQRWSEVLHTLKERSLVQYNKDTEFDKKKRLLPGSPSYSPFVRHDSRT